MANHFQCYQRDSFRRVIETEVVERRFGETGEGDGTTIVILADTVLHPQGGGQPADQGAIGGLPVVSVRRRRDGRIEHHVAGRLAADDVTVEVEWSRRFEHMQQHTAQHLLSGLAWRHFGWPTDGFGIQPEDSTILLPASGPDDPRIAELQAMANAAIRRDGRVLTRAVDVAALDGAGLRRSRDVPAFVRGAVRVVEVEGIDATPCGGTHVEWLRQVQAVRIVSVRNKKDVVEVRYVAGGRLLRQAGQDGDRAQQLGTMLKVKPEGLPVAVHDLLGRVRSSERDAVAGRLAYARCLGELLALQRVDHHEDDGSLDARALHALAEAWHGAGGQDFLIVVSGDRFQLAADPSRFRARTPHLLAALDGRGGWSKVGLAGRLGAGIQLERVREVLR